MPTRRTHSPSGTMPTPVGDATSRDSSPRRARHVAMSSSDHHQESSASADRQPAEHQPGERQTVPALAGPPDLGARRMCPRITAGIAGEPDGHRRMIPQISATRRPFVVRLRHAAAGRNVRGTAAAARRLRYRPLRQIGDQQRPARPTVRRLVGPRRPASRTPSAPCRPSREAGSEHIDGPLPVGMRGEHRCAGPRSPGCGGLPTPATAGTPLRACPARTAHHRP